MSSSEDLTDDARAERSGSASEEYAARLLRAVHGEQFGEAFFTGFARRVADSSHALWLERLAELERRMGACIERLALAQGVDLPGSSGAGVRGEAAAVEVARRPWHEVIDSF